MVIYSIVYYPDVKKIGWFVSVTELGCFKKYVRWNVCHRAMRM